MIFASMDSLERVSPREALSIYMVHQADIINWAIMAPWPKLNLEVFDPAVAERWAKHNAAQKEMLNLGRKLYQLPEVNNFIKSQWHKPVILFPLDELELAGYSLEFTRFDENRLDMVVRLLDGLLYIACHTLQV